MLNDSPVFAQPTHPSLCRVHHTTTALVGHPKAPRDAVSERPNNEIYASKKQPAARPHRAVVKDTVTSACQETVGAAAGVYEHLQYILVLKIGRHTHTGGESHCDRLSLPLCLALSLFLSAFLSLEQSKIGHA